MTTPITPPGAPRGTLSTLLLVGFLVLLPMAFGLVQLPMTDASPLGATAWLLVGALAALWHGGLLASVGGAAAGIGLGTLVYGGVSRAFTNTPWLMTPAEFAPRLGLTVAVCMGAVAVGHVLLSSLGGRSAPVASARGLAAVVMAGVLVVGGGTLYANAIRAVIPWGAVQPRIEFSTAGVAVQPATFASGPTYWTFANLDLEMPAEFAIFRVESDELKAQLLTGEMGGTYDDGARQVGWTLVGPPGQTGLRPGPELDPGHYLVLCVEPLPEGSELGEEADRVVIDGLNAEFTVSD
jgi:hypothetical protein